MRLFPGASRERFTATLHERVWHQIECMTDGLVGFALPLSSAPDIRQTCDDEAFTREDGVSGPQTA